VGDEREGLTFAYAKREQSWVLAEAAYEELEARVEELTQELEDARQNSQNSSRVQREQRAELSAMRKSVDVAERRITELEAALLKIHDESGSPLAIHLAGAVLSGKETAKPSSDRAA
jgi:chromosome segregation ATPase